MTTLEKWRFYMADCKSPDSYINMGFYFMISACLQRRVWVGSEHSPLFPNQFMILVGEPGLGKGRVISPLNQMLRYHKQVTANRRLEAKDITDIVLAAKGAEPEDEALLFPMAPNSCTFEALTRELSDLMRVFKIEVKQADGTSQILHYTHKSLCFLLEELASVVPTGKHAENVINFLLQAFDCADFDYITKHNGKDRLRKVCLNLLAGTTPDFMRNAFDSKLLSQGFSARTLFVYEYANRSNRFTEAAFTPEQMQARKEVLAHIHGLARLYGQVRYTPEAFEVMRHYFEEVLPVRRANYSPKLASYYARKNIHVQKLAMAIHFADHYSMVIEEQTVRHAFALLEALEKKMHLALNFGKNPLAGLSAQVAIYLKTAGPKTFADLWAEFNDDLREQELRECINYLCGTSKIIMYSEAGQTLYRDVTWKAPSNPSPSQSPSSSSTAEPVV